MGTGNKRKVKEETNLQDDAVLGELLGEIKTAGKSGSANKPSSEKSGKNAPKTHHNPFAVVRPISTGIKRKIEPKVEMPAPKKGTIFNSF